MRNLAPDPASKIATSGKRDDEIRIISTLIKRKSIPFASEIPMTFISLLSMLVGSYIR